MTDIFVDGAHPHISTLDDLLEDENTTPYVLSGWAIESVDFGKLSLLFTQYYADNPEAEQEINQLYQTLDTLLQEKEIYLVMTDWKEILPQWTGVQEWMRVMRGQILYTCDQKAYETCRAYIRVFHEFMHQIQGSWWVVQSFIGLVWKGILQGTLEEVIYYDIGDSLIYKDIQEYTQRNQNTAETYYRNAIAYEYYAALLMLDYIESEAQQQDISIRKSHDSIESALSMLPLWLTLDREETLAILRSAYAHHLDDHYVNLRWIGIVRRNLVWLKFIQTIVPRLFGFHERRSQMEQDYAGLSVWLDDMISEAQEEEKKIQREKIKEDVENGLITDEDIESTIDKYVTVYYGDWYSKNGSIWACYQKIHGATNSNGNKIIVMTTHDSDGFFLWGIKYQIQYGWSWSWDSGTQSLENAVYGILAKNWYEKESIQWNIKEDIQDALCGRVEYSYDSEIYHDVFFAEIYNSKVVASGHIQTNKETKQVRDEQIDQLSDEDRENIQINARSIKIEAEIRSIAQLLELYGLENEWIYPVGLYTWKDLVNTYLLSYGSDDYDSSLIPHARYKTEDGELRKMTDILYYTNKESDIYEWFVAAPNGLSKYSQSLNYLDLANPEETVGWHIVYID